MPVNRAKIPYSSDVQASMSNSRRGGHFARWFRAASVAGYLDVGQQHADTTGGQPAHTLEERAGLGGGDRQTGGVVVGVVEVDHPIGGSRRAVLFRPHLR